MGIKYRSERLHMHKVNQHKIRTSVFEPLEKAMNEGEDLKKTGGPFEKLPDSFEGKHAAEE